MTHGGWQSSALAFPAEPVMHFGRHQGRRLADIEDAYLYWLVSRPWVYPETREEVRDELRQRAVRRRSWRPIVKTIFGRRLLDVIGQGPYAVVQPCGIERRELTVWLYDTAALAQEHRQDDCGYEGRDGCEDRCHYVMDLIDWTRLSDKGPPPPEDSAEDVR
jgi:hypothetical protein